MTKEEILELLPEANRIHDRVLRDRVLDTWSLAIEEGGWDRVDSIPFTLLIPEVRISLVEHTRVVTQLAISVAETLDGIDLDHLIAGALTHDVGKLLEYERTGDKVVKSALGKLVRHPVSGYSLAVRAGLPLEVCHIIIAHSHEGDQITRSKEALIINRCDFIHFDFVKASI